MASNKSSAPSVNDFGNTLNNGSSRDLAIDRFRGFLVIAMVVGDFIAGVNWIPTWLKHAPDIGFTVADAVAPAFVFIIGLNYGSSFSRRLAESASAAYRHFANRYLALIGIGSLISAGSMLVGRDSSWGVLQSLGTAGLICLMFIRFPTWLRLVAGSMILVLYQYLLDSFLLKSVIDSSHGGPFGSVSWAALLILSTAVADIWRKGIRSYVLASVALSLFATFAVLLVPVSKNRVSLSFIVLTLTISATTFLIFKSFTRFVPNRAGIFSWWGQRALYMYLLHLLLLSIFVLPAVSWWYEDVSLWLLVMQLIGLLGLMTIVARHLANRYRS